MTDTRACPFAGREWFEGWTWVRWEPRDRLRTLLCSRSLSKVAQAPQVGFGLPVTAAPSRVGVLSTATSEVALHPPAWAFGQGPPSEWQATSVTIPISRSFSVCYLLRHFTHLCNS